MPKFRVRTHGEANVPASRAGSVTKLSPKWCDNVRLGRTSRLCGRSTEFQSQTLILPTQPISNFHFQTPDFRLAIDYRLLPILFFCVLSLQLDRPIKWFDQVRLGATGPDCAQKTSLRTPF